MPKVVRDLHEKELFKKIALRFLKESGLYHSFLKYLFYNDMSELIASHKEWYNKKFIDDIFGSTYFTSFLEKRILNKPFGFTITDLFKAYVTKKYPGKFRFILPIYQMEVLYLVNELTDVIKFNKNEKEK